MIMNIFVGENMNKKKIVGLTTGGHNFHIKIMKDNKAQIFNMGKGIKRFINEFLNLPKADIYITEGNYYAPIIIMKLLLKKKVKVINIAGSPSIFTTNNFILKKLLNHIDVMLVEGEFGKDRIIQRGFTGAVQVIYPDISRVSDFDYYKEKVYDRKKKMKILCVANNSWKVKGLDILEQAIKDLDCEVYIVGRTEFIPKSPKITMVGYLNKYQLNEYYERCNVYVQPSRFDTFSISVLEAVYKGLPVIVSDNCGVKEFVNDKWVFNDVSDLEFMLKRDFIKDTFKYYPFETKDKSLIIKELDI